MPPTAEQVDEARKRFESLMVDTCIVEWWDAGARAGTYDDINQMWTMPDPDAVLYDGPCRLLEPSALVSDLDTGEAGKAQVRHATTIEFPHDAPVRSGAVLTITASVFSAQLVDTRWLLVSVERQTSFGLVKRALIDAYEGTWGRNARV